MIDCDFCIHNKVCSFKSEYKKRKEDLYHDIFEVRCKQHSSSLTNAATIVSNYIEPNVKLLFVDEDDKVSFKSTILADFENKYDTDLKLEIEPEFSDVNKFKEGLNVTIEDYKERTIVNATLKYKDAKKLSTMLNKYISMAEYSNADIIK